MNDEIIVIIPARKGEAVVFFSTAHYQSIIL